MYFPPGTYYVGDFCYVRNTEDNSLTEALFNAHDRAGWEGAVELTYNNLPVWDAHTCYGDGEYPDQHGRRYSVDSGTIGVLPLTLCDEHSLSDLCGCGHILTFDTGFTPHWEDGVFTLGPLTIDTRDYAEADE